MRVNVMGEDLLACKPDGQPCVRIATAFPHANTVVALAEMPMHALQRMEFAASVSAARVAEGQPPLSEEELEAEMDLGVDLIVDERGVLIRPDPARMDLALAADEMLQKDIPKRRVKYLFLSDVRVRDTLKRRGECWRMFRPPTAPLEIRRLIAESLSAIDGLPIYYYSAVSGTRFLTCDNLKKLDQLDDDGLRKHLAEISTYLVRRNHHGCREVEMFMADPAPDPGDFEGAACGTPELLRSRFHALCTMLSARVPPAYRHDDLDDAAWRRRMFNRLMAQPGDSVEDDESTELDPDFLLRMEWLPACRIELGELLMDPAIAEPYGAGSEKQVSSVVPGLIMNLVQEYGDLEYINFASVLPSPDRNEGRGGRREVYVAQIKQRGAAKEVLLIIRMQKWGVRERLIAGRTLEQAMTESEEYTEYVLDRRLACRQLGMNLANRQTARKVSENFGGKRIWTPYFQRDYVIGIATNQLPARKLADPAYAVALARLLGKAAASNLVVGRAELTNEAIFDVGDEIVMEDKHGLPWQIAVSDHVGTFVDWTGTLESRCAEYAQPILRRLKLVPDRVAFAEAYLAGFIGQLVHMQEECAKHERAFETLFKYRSWEAEGGLSCRWTGAIKRLRKANADQLGQLVRGHLNGHL